MKILICPDKFKGSLSAVEASDAMAQGARRAFPGAQIERMPIADGGEGTVEAFCSALGGEIVTCRAHDPLGRSIDTFYGRLPDGSAVVEMAAVSGLRLVAEWERDPLRSTTFGLGEVLLHAASSDAAKIFVGLGGSATNDAGVGMAAALGYRFLDGEGRAFNPIPSEFRRIARVIPPRKPAISNCLVLCDVTNPLTGPDGATNIYGPQKGVRPEQCKELDEALAHVSTLVSRDLGIEAVNIPGAGAAGGTGFGMMAFVGAKLRPGFEVIAEVMGLREKIQQADVVLTGEGRLDAQSKSGKAPCGVAQLAQQLGKRVVCIPGISTLEGEIDGMFDRVLPLVREGITSEMAMANAALLLEERAWEILREFGY